jgi:hypothetical protein
MGTPNSMRILYNDGFGSGEEKEIRILLNPSERVNFNNWLALSKGSNRAGVSLPSLEDGNRSNLRNVVFSSYLDYMTID